MIVFVVIVVSRLQSGAYLYGIHIV